MVLEIAGGFIGIAVGVGLVLAFNWITRGRRYP
jgi:hypothetical protein